jgi:glycosyltransferase involved in cell wall biosynthesis
MSRMKLLFLYSNIHHKNKEGIELMCKSHSIELEFTNSFQRCQRFDYDILISNNQYFDVSCFPEHIPIIFGPQLWVFPEGEIIGPLDVNIQRRAAFNTLSTWNSIRLLEDKHLKVPCVEFPFAVNIDKFIPDTSIEKTIDCLVYKKSRNPEHYKQVNDFLDTKNIKYYSIQYGSYNEQQYIDLLRKSKCMIVIDSTESQGFALQEAMACNVPLLVWDATSMHDEFSNGKYVYNSNPLPLRGTSVPYWSSECGIKVYTFDALVFNLEQMLTSYRDFNPRKYIVDELSPYKCMERLLTYFKLKDNNVKRSDAIA